MTFYHIILYNVLLYHVILIISNYIDSIMLYHGISYYIVSYYTIFYSIIFYYIILYFIISYHMYSYVIALNYIVLWYIRLSSNKKTENNQCVYIYIYTYSHTLSYAPSKTSALEIRPGTPHRKPPPALSRSSLSMLACVITAQAVMMLLDKTTGWVTEGEIFRCSLIHP